MSRKKWSRRSSLFGYCWCQVHKWPSSSRKKLLGWRGSRSRRQNPGFGECTSRLNDDKAAWWVNNSRVRTYCWKGESYLFTPSAYIYGVQASDTPLFYFIFHWISCPCRAEIVHWVSGSKRPFKIVTDHAFCNLMKTGRPEYPIPSPQTVSQDVRHVFVGARKRIAKMLQVCSFVYLFLKEII